MGSDKEHMACVSALGCIACRNEGLGETPAGIHHIRDGYGRGQRAPDTETIPLCGIHHQTGDGKAGSGFQIGYHFNSQEFERRYGTERELLAQVRRELGIDG